MSLSSELVEIQVNNRMLSWYRGKGYDIPTHVSQQWATVNGRRVKNGVEHRVARGTKIRVRRSDLMPASNVVLDFKCATCGKSFTTTAGASRLKISNNCKSCQAKKGFKGGCHSYWVAKLITENTDARCDISGETDKRFLELHHLLSRSVGGEDGVENYVILSANYHRAFHNWMGSSNVPCRPEDYHTFKSLEARGCVPLRKIDRSAG